MSLAEIETLFDALSPAEQAELLRHLEYRLRGKSVLHSRSVQQWMHRLDLLRDSLSTGRCSISSEQIIDELRGVGYGNNYSSSSV